MKYQICKNCVMDSSDSKITFDENGICDHCITFKNSIQPFWYTDDRGKTKLEELVKKITAEFDAFATDAKLQVEKNNKAAGTRARKSSLDLEKLLKEFRKVSVEASKK